MGAYSSAVRHGSGHVWVLGELFRYIDPNTVHFPACATLKDTVPLAKIVGQFRPLGAGAQNPVNYLNETSTLSLLPRASTRVFLQECEEFLSLMVGNLLGRHPTIAANLTELNSRLRVLVTASASMKRCHQELKTKDFHISADSGRSRSGCAGGRGGSRCRGCAR